MRKLMLIVNKSFISLVTLVISVFAPFTVLTSATMAEEDPADSSTSTAQTEDPAPSSTEQNPSTGPTPSTTQTSEPAPPPPPPAPATGPTQPNGADSKTYKYNEATGMWENDYYVWDPVTKKTRPKNQPSYSYNPATGMWDTTQWRFDTASGKYVPNTVSVQQAPAGAKLAPTANALTANPLATASGGNSTINANNTNSHVFDLFYNAFISNNLNSTARSGDVNVYSNTSAGNGMSGMASALANIISMLNSSWGSIDAAKFATFVSNIYGNVYGDLYIDPNSLAPGQDANINVNNNNNLDVNAEQNARINNDINLNATSGNTNVSQNTNAGNAGTGDAHAVANLMNLINSAIAADQSFVGVLNIYGSLEGDILLPPEIRQAILASNEPGSTNSFTSNNTNTLNANLTNNTDINNNINAAASTGDVNAEANTKVGDVSSGNAKTNVTLLNLTGRQVVASNSLLVFVNVLGDWVGLIMDAPAGTTAAALGGGVSQNTTINNTNTANLDLENNSTINNNVNVNATSGDATATSNTSVGDVSSGDATASVNVLNVVNSQLALSDWFGVLFINVFGSWEGSFGVDTASGNPKPAVASPAPSVSSGVFQFVPATVSTTTGNRGSGTTLAAGQVAAAVTTPQPETSQEVLAVSTTNNTPDNDSAALQAARNHWLVPVVGSLTGMALIGAERGMAHRQRRRIS